MTNSDDYEVHGSKKAKLEKTAIHSRKTLNPKKLLLTKWTALAIVAKQKHFIVSRIIAPLEGQQNISEV
jgi:hypothetical protein